MKLRSKSLIIENSKGLPVNVEGREIILDLNGGRLPLRLSDIFSHWEFDDGEISGNSLLNFYKVQEDGSLEVAGSKIQLIDAQTNELILVKAIKNISMGYDESELSFEDIKKFSEHFNVQNPEEVFPLTASEKEAIIAERIEREKQGQTVVIEEQQKESAESILEKQNAAEAERQVKMQNAAEAERQVKIKELADYKASLDPKYVQNKTEYIAAESFYLSPSIGFKKFEKDEYTLFYGDTNKEVPCLLIKRGEWWEECDEETLIMTDKTDAQVVFEFMDNKTPKTLTVDVATGQITVSE